MSAMIVFGEMTEKSRSFLTFMCSIFVMARVSCMAYCCSSSFKAFKALVFLTIALPPIVLLFKVILLGDYPNPYFPPFSSSSSMSSPSLTSLSSPSYPDLPLTLTTFFFFTTFLLPSLSFPIILFFKLMPLASLSLTHLSKKASSFFF